jgi:hypothetical protein
MSRFQVHPLTSIAIVEDGEAQELSAEFEAHVEAVWQAERAARGEKLFDAQLFSLTHVDGSNLRGHFVPYRRFLAQLRRPELRDALGIQPCAVCALTFAQGALLFGRRSEHTTQDPGAWEPVPAGAIGVGARGEGNELSARKQLLEELQEEINLTSDHVTRMEPFALIIDLETGVHDIAFEILLDLSVAEAEALFRVRNTREVSALCGVARDDVSEWIRAAIEPVAPITHSLFEAWRIESSSR